ncbi:histone-lysine N-methyltransferase SETMAR-like [Vespa crabro]|uniref:histone-lysine N-methyltransferase SETMAR-like n=1 Tax=Vespa crabro TaxID=7445 RepID=UPI001F00E5CD|nr:histone-lysine N-methyltransferase SETMAR-like [Vespa crabro]
MYVSARKFRSGNFNVEDALHSGRPVEADKDTVKALVDANRRITTRKIGERLNLSNSTVYDHLKGLGLTPKFDIWVPHILTKKNLCRRVDVCDLLLKRHENDPFLKRIINGDEKWELNRFFEILPDNTTINSEVYCHQLDKLNDALQQKRSELINRKRVMFLEDNARPHTSLVSRQKLSQLEWDTMSHPPYSPSGTFGLLFVPVTAKFFRRFLNLHLYTHHHKSILSNNMPNSCPLKPHVVRASSQRHPERLLIFTCQRIKENYRPSQ